MKFLCLVFVLFVSCLIAEEIELPTEINKQDTLLFYNQENIIDSTANDSLLIEPAEQDSLYSEAEIESKPERTRTSIYDLKQKIDSEIEKIGHLPDYFAAPQFIFSENYHLSSLFHTPFWLEKNGFLLSSLPALDYLQMYAPFYYQNFSGSFASLFSSDYQQPVSLAKSYLGMGANDMNHAFVSFRKGKIMNFPTAEFAFLSYDGIWHGDNELAKMYHTNLHFPSRFGNLFISGTITEKLNLNRTETITLKGHDLDFVWHFRSVRLGYRHESLEIADVQKEKQMFIEQQGTFGNHSYRIKSNLLQNKSSELLSQLKTKSTFSDLIWQNSAIWRNHDNFSWQTNLTFTRLNELEFETSQNRFSSSDHLLFYPAFSSGFRWNWQNNVTQSIFYEKHSFGNHTYQGLMTAHAIQFPLSRFKIHYDNRIQIIRNDNSQLPAWLVKQKFSIIRALLHDNQISLGFTHYLSGEFQNESGHINRVHVFNAFVRIQISKLFQIQFSGINLLMQSFEPVIPYKRGYLAVSLNWIFLN